MKRSSLLALPALAGTLLLTAVPMLGVLGLSFTDFDGISPPEVSGLSNFARMAHDPLLKTVAWNSLILVILAVPLRIGGALLFSGLLARIGSRSKGSSLFIPTVIPDLAYCVAWLWILNPLFGPVASLLRMVGGGSEWILSAWGARMSIAVILSLQIGEGIAVLLAARSQIPVELIEAAQIEGAGHRWISRRILLPLLSPVLMVLTARDLSLVLHLSFVPALIVTRGGPIYATTFLPNYIYTNAFEFLKLGYASAITLLTFLVILALMGLQWLAFRKILGKVSP